MVKKIVSVETYELTVDCDYLSKVLKSTVGYLFEKLLSNLHIDIERGNHLMMN